MYCSNVQAQVDDAIEKWSEAAGGLDTVTYTAMLGACMHDSRRAQQLLQEMRDKVQTALYTYC
jgi:hypothetical protein